VSPHSARFCCSLRAPDRDNDLFDRLGADPDEVPSYEVTDEKVDDLDGDLSRQKATLVVLDRSVRSSLAALTDWASRATHTGRRRFTGREARYPIVMADREALPIPDYDHLPEGSLAHRIRALDADGLRLILDHERAHGDRLPVVALLEERLQAVESDEATPSGGDPAGAQPEQAPPPAGGSAGNAAKAQVNNQPLREGQAAQTPNRDIRGR
jgi:hypothetical protein